MEFRTADYKTFLAWEKRRWDNADKHVPKGALVKEAQGEWLSKTRRREYAEAVRTLEDSLREAEARDKKIHAIPKKFVKRSLTPIEAQRRRWQTLDDARNAWGHVLRDLNHFLDEQLERNGAGAIIANGRSTAYTSQLTNQIQQRLKELNRDLDQCRDACAALGSPVSEIEDSDPDGEDESDDEDEEGEDDKGEGGKLRDHQGLEVDGKSSEEDAAPDEPDYPIITFTPVNPDRASERKYARAPKKNMKSQRGLVGPSTDSRLSESILKSSIGPRKRKSTEKQGPGQKRKRSRSEGVPDEATRKPKTSSSAKGGAFEEEQEDEDDLYRLASGTSRSRRSASSSSPSEKIEEPQMKLKEFLEHWEKFRKFASKKGIVGGEWKLGFIRPRCDEEDF